MSQASSRFLRALRDLLIAMINATLILVALCLFLWLRVTDRVEHIATEIAQSVLSLDPLREDVQHMTEELSGLRAELASVRENSGERTSEAGQALQARLESLDARLDAVGERAGDVRERLQSVQLDPSALVDHAIETASVELVQAVGLLAGCELPAVEAMQAVTAPKGGLATEATADEE